MKLKILRKEQVVVVVMHWSKRPRHKRIDGTLRFKPSQRIIKEWDFALRPSILSTNVPPLRDTGYAKRGKQTNTLIRCVENEMKVAQAEIASKSV